MPYMARYKLTIAYEGTDFHGWQKQLPPDEEPLRTVQGVLEEALAKVFRQPISVQGASRTDTGVHARHQVAAFDCQTQIDIKRIASAINYRLPDDVQIKKATITHDNFEPTSDALSKGYRYRIAYGNKGQYHQPLFSRRLTYFSGYELDPQRMNQAAQHFIGKHDFAGFAKADHGRDTTIRTIHDCKVISKSNRRCWIDISGNGFLHNMVRIIAGTLIEIGRGRYEPDHVKEIIKSKDRDKAGSTLPPEGLFLMWIKYQEAKS